jgi:cytochrome P450
MAITVPTDPPAPPAGFNPISQEFLDDPQRWLRVAREEQPVFYAADFGFWAVTRYADVERVLTDHKTFSSESLAFIPVPEQFSDQVPPGFFATGALVSQDPPRHTPRRKLINQGFARSRMAAMAAPIEAICHELIDAFEADGHADLMTQYCYEVSLRSIVHLMGLPTDDLPRLRQLADDQGAAVSDVVKPMGDEERIERWTRIVGARAYLDAIARARVEEPGDDLVSLMVSAKDAEGRPVLSPSDAVTHLTELVFAGTDTTANLMALLVRLFDEHPGELAAVRADPELWPGAIEEGLRVRSAANGVFRITTEDVELSGVTIPARSLLWVAISSAGHDAEKFDDPARFNVRRANSGDHISFGKGRHFCMGAPLTRVEAPIGLRVLYDRLPNLRVVPDQTYAYDPVLAAVILTGLQVTW